jgi:hypothetical protein
VNDPLAIDAQRFLPPGEVRLCEPLKGEH